MKRFTFKVIVEAETQEQAEQVIIERTQYDEDYGFDYRIFAY